MLAPTRLTVYADITGDRVPDRITVSLTDDQMRRAVSGDVIPATYIDGRTGRRATTDAVHYASGTMRMDGSPITSTFVLTADAPVVNGKAGDGWKDEISITHKHSTDETIYTVTADAASPDGHALSEECRSYAAQHRSNYALEGGRDSLLDYRPWLREVSKSTHPLKRIPDSWKHDDTRLDGGKKDVLVKS